MNEFPYYDEPVHDQGVITNAAGNAAKDTTIAAAEGRLKVECSDKVFLLEPNKHPLVSLLTNVGKVYDGKAWTGSGILKQSTSNPEFKWLEDFYGGKYCKVSGTYAASGTVTITVTGAGSSSAYIFTVGDVVMNARTGERFMITTVASAATVTVDTAVRSLGATVAAAGADGDELFIIGNANEENSGARNANSTRISPESNYTF